MFERISPRSLDNLGYTNFNLNNENNPIHLLKRESTPDDFLRMWYNFVGIMIIFIIFSFVIGAIIIAIITKKYIESRERDKAKLGNLYSKNIKDNNYNNNNNNANINVNNNVNPNNQPVNNNGIPYPQPVYVIPNPAYPNVQPPNMIQPVGIIAPSNMLVPPTSQVVPVTTVSPSGNTAVPTTLPTSTPSPSPSPSASHTPLLLNPDFNELNARMGDEAPPPYSLLNEPSQSVPTTST